MSFDEILEQATTDALLYVDDREFMVAGIEKVELATGDRVIWLWSTDGAWLVIDQEGDELISLRPCEEEVSEEDDYATYLSKSYEEVEEDQGSVKLAEGEVEQEVGDAFEVKQYEGEGSGLLRCLVWTGFGEEMWFYGKMLGEDDVRVA